MVWEGWWAVIVTVMVSTTVPINKKQKKVGMKYLAKIPSESSLCVRDAAYDLLAPGV